MNEKISPDEVSNGRIDVRGDGRILLYKREGLKRPKWQARLKIAGSTGYKIISTKTDRLREAETFAINLYDELTHHVRMGGSIKSKSFAQVFDEWERSCALTSTPQASGSANATVERVRAYALEYFGPMKIEEIKGADFQKFWLWRKENFAKRAPTNGTLGRERTAILSVFKHAIKMGYIAKIPASDAPKSKGERRPTFTEQEWKAVLGASDAWVAEGPKTTKRDRFWALHCFLVLVNTGLRIGELRRLKWGDFRPIDNGAEKYVVAEVRGKTGGREVVCQPGTGKLLNRLIDARSVELKNRFPSQPKKWKPTRSELVLCHPDGAEIKTFKRAFHSLLRFADVPIHKNGMARTIYSLRHLYATQRLYEDVSPFHLAKQMGTSVEMLERHYGQTITSQAAAQITKTRKTSKPSNDTGIRRFDE